LNCSYRAIFDAVRSVVHPRQSGKAVLTSVSHAASQLFYSRADFYCVAV
jgi:hypothetical protein